GGLVRLGLACLAPLRQCRVSHSLTLCPAKAGRFLVQATGSRATTRVAPREVRLSSSVFLAHGQAIPVRPTVQRHAGVYPLLPYNARAEAPSSAACKQQLSSVFL